MITALVVVIVILALTNLATIYIYKLQTDKMINALIARSAEEFSKLEVITNPNNVNHVPVEPPIIPDGFTPLEDLSDQEFGNVIGGDNGSQG